jgi:hypothetical protein
MPAAEQCEFKDGCQIQQDSGVVAVGSSITAGLDTADDSIIPRLLNGFTLGGNRYSGSLHKSLKLNKFELLIWTGYHRA